MNCPGCNAANLRRSRRRGIYEGLVLRVLYFAPYRCEACGQRFTVSSFGQRARAHRHRQSATAYLGLRGPAKKRFVRAVKFAVVGIALILVAIWLVLQLGGTATTPRVQPIESALGSELAFFLRS